MYLAGMCMITCIVFVLLFVGLAQKAQSNEDPTPMPLSYTYSHVTFQLNHFIYEFTKKWPDDMTYVERMNVAKTLRWHITTWKEKADEQEKRYFTKERLLYGPAHINTTPIYSSSEASSLALLMEEVYKIYCEKDLKVFMDIYEMGRLRDKYLEWVDIYHPQQNEDILKLH